MILKRQIPWLRLIAWALLWGFGAFVYGLFTWGGMRSLLFGVYVALLCLSVVLLRVLYIDRSK